MSRTKKRNTHRIYGAVREERGGRIPIVRKDPDKNVSHGKPCYLCVRGTVPKRLMHTKPRRRTEKHQLQLELRESLHAPL